MRFAIFNRNIFTAMRNRDIIFRKQRIAVFVNDCYWYGHPGCPCGQPTVPDGTMWVRRAERIRKMNRELWAELSSRGWTVLIMWECEMEGTAERSSHRGLFRDYLRILHKEISRLKLILIK